MQDLLTYIYPLRVHIEDTDYAGVVYHSNYLNFMERARSEWMSQLGLGVEWQRENNVHFAVRAIQLDFLKPALLHQWVEVVSRITQLRPASVIFDQYLRLKDIPDTILCKAEIKVACIDKSFLPQALPLKVHHLLENYCDI